MAQRMEDVMNYLEESAMIDTANLNVRPIQTPDGIKTLVQYAYKDGSVVAVHAAGGGKIKKYRIEDCEEVQQEEK